MKIGKFLSVRRILLLAFVSAAFVALTMFSTLFPVDGNPAETASGNIADTVSAGSAETMSGNVTDTASGDSAATETGTETDFDNQSGDNSSLTDGNTAQTSGFSVETSSLEQVLQRIESLWDERIESLLDKRMEILYDKVQKHIDALFHTQFNVIVGLFIGLFLIILTLFFFMRRTRKRTLSDSPDSNEEPSETSMNMETISVGTTGNMLTAGIFGNEGIQIDRIIRGMEARFGNMETRFGDMETQLKTLSGDVAQLKTSSEDIASLLEKLNRETAIQPEETIRNSCACSEEQKAKLDELEAKLDKLDELNENVEGLTHELRRLFQTFGQNAATAPPKNLSAPDPPLQSYEEPSQEPKAERRFVKFPQRIRLTESDKTRINHAERQSEGYYKAMELVESRNGEIVITQYCPSDGSYLAEPWMSNKTLHEAELKNSAVTDCFLIQNISRANGSSIKVNVRQPAELRINNEGIYHIVSQGKLIVIGT